MRSITLRPWQRDALAAFDRRHRDSFLAVACPGAGKTTFALAAVRQYLRGERKPIVIVVPTAHLKTQWAHAASRFAVHLEPDWNAKLGLPADMHGIVVTYAQAASSAKALRKLVAGGIAVLDEIHHAADERSWGDGVREAFADADCRLLLSGTPFRTDDSPIPFVDYSFGDYGDAVADYEYGYGDALRDGGIVRPVFFPRFDGHMEWRSADGEEMSASFDEDIRRDQWGARMRTALSPEGEWLPTVLARAHQQLLSIRATHKNAAGLVIAIDQEHARAIARLLERRQVMENGQKPKVHIALSDDPKASKVIASFGESADPWIVAVRMISEGVDIPRLRVGVYATTTSTAMFFRQAVGRIARWSPGMRSQKAYMFLPDDPRLRHLATTIAQQRRHSIEARRRREVEEGALDELPGVPDQEEQLSLFMALSSKVTDEAEPAPPADGLDPDEDIQVDGTGLLGFTVDLPPPPPLPGRQPDPRSALADMRTRESEKRALREFNSARVSELARATGLDHAKINSELNKRARVRSMADATVDQLERRLKVADDWLHSLRG